MTPGAAAEATRAETAAPTVAGGGPARNVRRLLGIGLGVALVAVLPSLVPEFTVTLLNYIGLYTLVALGLVLLTGVAGQTSFGQAAFVGIGAYTSAVLTTQTGLSPWLTLPIALALAGMLAWIIGLITLRMSGHYLPLGTIAWGISLFYLFGTLPNLGGFGGISDIPTLSVGTLELRGVGHFYYLIWAIVIAALWASANLLDSRIGRAVRALKARATMVESFGVDPAKLRVKVFVYAALLAALSGWLYAHMQRFINPTPFSLNTGIEYLFMAVVGGSGSVLGAVLGALGVTLLKELLQSMLQRFAGESGPYELIVFGIAIVLMLQYAKNGLWPLAAKVLSPFLVRPTVVRTDVGAGAGAVAGAGADRAASDPVASSLERRPRADPPAGQPLLAIDDVVKRFGGLVATNHVSFAIHPGEILGLIGPNGAGKSTMFNLITGHLPPSSGAIRFAGRPLDGMLPAEIARLGMARSFQHVKLIGQMSVIENVAIGASLRAHKGFVATCLGLDAAEEQALLAEAAGQVARVGLAGHEWDAAGSLPLGKQRIVEIARALCADPTLLLLDEPAAGLRYQEKQELAALLRDLRGQGMTVLLVEHDMDFVMSLTDRLVVLRFGEKLAEGPPSEIQRNPAVLEAYLGGVE